MGATQKYKQQTQQVRIQTSEEHYTKGMFYTDTPLAEGYSRALVNLDIDGLTGDLSPRKGLHTINLVKPEGAARQYLNNQSGYNTVLKTKVCATSDRSDPRKINRYLQSIIYNTDTADLSVITSPADALENTAFRVSPFYLFESNEYTTPDPYVIEHPGIHNQLCAHNSFFKRPVGAFAFGDSFYTFLRHSQFAAHLKMVLPNDLYFTYTDLQRKPPKDMRPGDYFLFIDDISKGTIAYCDTDMQIKVWQGTEEELKNYTFTELSAKSELCYTKIGSEIQPDDVLLNDADRAGIIPNKYYVCKVVPKLLNPTEASSWGYNMLLENPYDFVCESTAVNNVSILGIIPYGKDGKPVLTPKRNQEITLKGFYRAPKQYYTDAQNPRYYATAKKYITVSIEETVPEELEDGTYRLDRGNPDTVVFYGYIVVKENATPIKAYYYYDMSHKIVRVPEENIKKVTKYRKVTRDPKNRTELNEHVSANEYSVGDWWYCTDEKLYYMVMPHGTTTGKQLEAFGTTQPAASEKLTILGLAQEQENNVRVKWQMRSAGAATWTDLYNETFRLSDYYARNNNTQAPFTLTTVLPENEVLIRLVVSDPVEIVANEELVLATSTIGITTISDDTTNTLNIEAKTFDLGKCTGMCEWEHRLVLWGVPGALNTVFISDVNNPAFFPYPNNVDVFTEPIRAVHNYGDELLVLTTSALYRLIWNGDGLGWTHKLVQQNLHVAEEDTYMSCVIKNMFFFKSREYYYLMVPKATTAASVRGEVAIAPISKPIEKLLDNFHKEVYNLIEIIAGNNRIDFTRDLVNYFSYTDNTRVVVNYVYSLDRITSEQNGQNAETSKYLYVQLIYDTDSRTWYMRIFEAPHMLYASHADAIQQDMFIDLTPAKTEDRLFLQYYRFEKYKDDFVQYIDENNFAVPVKNIIQNVQYLDTGNRDINTELKKRFREFQFKMKFEPVSKINFTTAFYIDGSTQKDLKRYMPRVQYTDDLEQVIIVERVLAPPVQYALRDEHQTKPTILGADPNEWHLSESAFPGRKLCKIRMPVSGKGYSPRVVIRIDCKESFTVYGNSWVYRTMNSR